VRPLAGLVPLLASLAASLLACAPRAVSAPASPAVVGIVAAFAQHPVVAIAEAHGVRQAGDFYIELARDPAFQRTVNDIVIEFASGRSQALLDRYIVDGNSLAPDSLRSILRNSTKLGWDSGVYARWLAAVRAANRGRPREARTRVLAGDTPVDWSRLRTPADWAALGPNDVSFARVIEDSVLAKGRKALVVLGSNHLGRRGEFRDDAPNTTTRVEAAHPGAMWIVLTWSGWPGGDAAETRLVAEHGVTPALVPLAGSWLGALPIESRAGARSRFDQRADALLWLGPMKSLDAEPPVRAELDAYDVDELDRRSWIEFGDSARARKFLGLGRVTEHTLASPNADRPRRIWVYTPPGYAGRDSSADDLLIVFDGGVYLTQIPLPAILDSLITAKALRPTVAVMVDDSSRAARLADLANHESWVRFVGDDLVPWARSGWNVTRDPHRTTLTGSSAGGLASAFLALRRPDLFGNVLSQSGAFWRGPEGTDGAPFEFVTSLVPGAPRKDVRFFLDVGSTESSGAMGGSAPSILAANRRLRDALRAKGYAVTYNEVPGGVHAAETWGPRLPIGLAALCGQAAPAAR
jgi:enterochelin esterase-like enzyme